MRSKNDLIDSLHTILSSLSHQNIQELKDLLAQVNLLDEEEIEEVYSSFGGIAATTDIAKNSIDKLPYPIANLLRETNEQRNDLVRLLFLNETIECFVRWRLSEVLSIIHDERGFVIPDGILGNIPTSILRPSMGIWLGGFERLAKQVQKNTSDWGVDANSLARAKKMLDEIVKNRNKVSHGDIMGDAIVYLYGRKENKEENIEEIVGTVPSAEDIFAQYAKLNIDHYVIFNDTIYNANGCTITPVDTTISLHAKGNNRLDQLEHYYFFTKEKLPVLQIPCTFRVFEEKPTKTGSKHDFSTGTFISTHKDCKTINSGGELVYSLIDGKDTPHIKDLKEFVKLFKTDITIMSNEPWKGLLEELGGSSAWKIDRDLIKDCRKKYSVVANTGFQNERQTVETPEKIPLGSLWYFGCGPETGKTTLLFSYLYNTNTSGALVFPYRFSASAEKNILIDKFLSEIRDAIIFWLRKHTEVPMPDTTLKGTELFEDTNAKLMLLCSICPESEIVIGLDDMHHLYENGSETQPALESLLHYCAQWGQYTHTKEQIEFNHKTRERTYDSQCRRQVFVLGTGMDLGDERQDIDNFLSTAKHVQFVYHPDNIESYYPKEKLPKIPEDISKEEKQKYPSSRERELHDHESNPIGSHMPKIGAYGAVEIMGENKRNQNFSQHMNPKGAGHKFIDDVVRISNHNPINIDTIADNLNNGDIAIKDPITEESFSLTSKGNTSPYLENTSYIVPMILCFLHELKAPLTISSLQVLCSNQPNPAPEQNIWISKALYTIPQYIEKVALSESNEDGSLAIGWQLRTTNPNSLFNELQLVQGLVQGRIQYLISNLNQMSDSVPLKGILQEYAGISNRPSGNVVQDIFAALQGALSSSVISVLQQFSTQSVLQYSSDALYQTAVIAPASLTWLQKASESALLHTQADSYTKSTSFQEFWLKQVNPEHTPIFSHQIKSMGYEENIEKTIPINEEYYVVIGAKNNSIAIYNQKRAQPEIVILKKASPQTAVDCVVVQQEEQAIVAVAIQNEVHLHTISLGNRAKLISTAIHDYTEAIIGLLVLEQSHIAVYGGRIEEKQWAVDVLSNLFATYTSQTLLVAGPVTSTHKPKYGLHIGEQGYITFGKTIVEIKTNSISDRFNIEFVPKEMPSVFSDGLLVQRGTKKESSESVWFSAKQTASQRLHNNAGKEAFHKIIFAESISEEQLLTVDYRGVLRIYEWGKNAPLCAIDLQLPEDIQTLNGGLLHEDRLLLYGTRGFMCFYDIQTIRSHPSQNNAINQQISLDMHFGGIKDAMHISNKLEGHNDLFLTWSDDNDIRLWSWSAGSLDKPEDFCIGLFRDHDDKIKGVHVIGNALVSIDIKQNIRTWNINADCMQQRSLLPTRNPNFIQQGILLGSTLWSLSKESGELVIESYPACGTQWSVSSAVQQQNAPNKITAPDVIKTYPLGQYVVLFQEFKKRILIFNTQTSSFVTPEPVEELAVKKVKKYTGFVLIATSTDVYRLSESLVLSGSLATARANESISTACSAGDDVYYATSELDEKGKASTTRHVYVSTSLTPLVTMISSAAIGGMHYEEGTLLFWIERASTGAPLDLYWYDCAAEQLREAPAHPLLKHGLKNIYHLPQEEGFSFQSGDNDIRWTLRFDYPLVAEDAINDNNGTKELLLEAHSDWEYASKNLPAMLAAYKDESNTLAKVYAESSPFGVIVYYLHAKGTGRLLWTGNSIRDFSVIAITEAGLVLLNKNRNIIALQLMKGDVPQPFAAITGG